MNMISGLKEKFYENNWFNKNNWVIFLYELIEESFTINKKEEKDLKLGLLDEKDKKEEKDLKLVLLKEKDKKEEKDLELGLLDEKDVKSIVKNINLNKIKPSILEKMIGKDFNFKNLKIKDVFLKNDEVGVIDLDGFSILVNFNGPDQFKNTLLKKEGQKVFMGLSKEFLKQINLKGNDFRYLSLQAVAKQIEKQLAQYGLKCTVFFDKNEQIFKIKMDGKIIKKITFSTETKKIRDFIININNFITEKTFLKELITKINGNPLSPFVFQGIQMDSFIENARHYNFLSLFLDITIYNSTNGLNINIQGNNFQEYLLNPNKIFINGIKDEKLKTEIRDIIKKFYFIPEVKGSKQQSFLIKLLNKRVKNIHLKLGSLTKYIIEEEVRKFGIFINFVPQQPHQIILNINFINISNKSEKKNILNVIKKITETKEMVSNSDLKKIKKIIERLGYNFNFSEGFMTITKPLKDKRLFTGGLFFEIIGIPEKLLYNFKKNIFYKTIKLIINIFSISLSLSFTKKGSFNPGINLDMEFLNIYLDFFLKINKGIINFFSRFSFFPIINGFIRDFFNFFFIYLTKNLLSKILIGKNLNDLLIINCNLNLLKENVHIGLLDIFRWIFSQKGREENIKDIFYILKDSQNKKTLEIFHNFVEKERTEEKKKLLREIKEKIIKKNKPKKVLSMEKELEIRNKLLLKIKKIQSKNFLEKFLLGINSVNSLFNIKRMFIEEEEKKQLLLFYFKKIPLLINVFYRGITIKFEKKLVIILDLLKKNFPLFSSFFSLRIKRQKDSLDTKKIERLEEKNELIKEITKKKTLTKEQIKKINKKPFSKFKTFLTEEKNEDEINLDIKDEFDFKEFEIINASLFDKDKKEISDENIKKRYILWRKRKKPFEEEEILKDLLNSIECNFFLLYFYSLYPECKKLSIKQEKEEKIFLRKSELNFFQRERKIAKLKKQFYFQQFFNIFYKFLGNFSYLLKKDFWILFNNEFSPICFNKDFFKFFFKYEIGFFLKIFNLLYYLGLPICIFSSISLRKMEHKKGEVKLQRFFLTTSLFFEMNNKFFEIFLKFKISFKENKMKINFILFTFELLKGHSFFPEIKLFFNKKISGIFSLIQIIYNLLVVKINDTVNKCSQIGTFDLIN